MADRYMKMCSASLIIRGKKLKITMTSPHTFWDGYHQQDKRWQILVRLCREENPVDCWLECKLVQPLWETMEVPQEIENRTWSSNSTFGCASKGDSLFLMFTAAFFSIAKVWEPPQCLSPDELTKERIVINICTQ